MRTDEISRAVQQAFRDREMVMKWSRGLTAYQMATLVAPYFIQGVDFRGCSKSHIVEALLGGVFCSPISKNQLMEKLDITFKELGNPKVGS